MSDAHVAKTLRELETDTAIDQNGYSRNGRPGILSNCPAPVQVSYLAYPGTMGAPFIDYIIATGYQSPTKTGCSRNPERLAAIKTKLLRNRGTAPLFDTARFTRDLECAYTVMWERTQRGEPPESFSIES